MYTLDMSEMPLGLCSSRFCSSINQALGKVTDVHPCNSDRLPPYIKKDGVLSVSFLSFHASTVSRPYRAWTMTDLSPPL